MAELCDACKTEKIGCACDGALDDGCFLCTPKKHPRPECPSSCPGFRQKIVGALEGGEVKMAQGALASVTAVMAGPPSAHDKAQSERYREIVMSVKHKPGGHTQQPAPEEIVKRDGKRLYTVTTIASSARYGGTRTVVACMSFERAKEIVEKNQGDIYECSYQLVVIEAIVADWLYYPIEEQYWYVWEADRDDKSKGAYYPIERPEAYKGVINFGIG